MQAQIWPRDDAERRSMEKAGWGDRLETVYRSRDLARGADILFAATGISDGPLLRGSRFTGRRR
jgi:fructose-1,6-bisphosphatase II